MRSTSFIFLQSFLLVVWFPVVIQSFGRPPSSAFLLSSRSSSSSSTTTTCRNDVSTSSAVVEKESDNKKNLFDSYQKPIILIGTNTENVLSQLGTNLASHLQTNVIEKIMIDEKDDNDEKALDVVLMTIDNDSTTTTTATAATKSLLSSYYDDGYLMIYINYQGGISSQVEEELIIPFTDYELCIKPGDLLDNDTATNNHLDWELQRLVSRALAVPAVTNEEAHLIMGEQTFFLSLTFPKIEQVEPFVEQICEDVDAMEYRMDLLEARDDRFEILYGMQLVRKLCRPHVTRVGAIPTMAASDEESLLEDIMPIVYTCRTANQAGTYPDETPEDIQNMFERLSWGLRGGVEVLDVESAWDPAQTTALLEKSQRRHASTLILGSHHVVGQETAGDLESAVRLFQQCQLDGRAHGAKVVLSTQQEEEDAVAYQAGLIAQSLLQQEEGNNKDVIPCISLMLGEVAQFSRVLNKQFTPVTHESLPFVAAPGQLSASELMTTRVMTKLLPSPKYYAILGHQISYSVSPQMHNAAFAAVILPNQYVRADVATVEEFVEGDFFKSEQFAGCSVTIPHKQSIMPYCDVLTPAARAIGSVNTIIVTEEMDEEEVDEDGDNVLKRVNVGDNTDWKGIYNPLQRRLMKRGTENKKACLVIGAGGTARAAAYAAQQLGLSPIYFYNRTPIKAQALVEEFNGILIQSLEDDDDDPMMDLSVIISTLPQSVGFTLPEALLQQNKDDSVVLLDVNYKPYTTDLIAQVEESTKNWNIVRGSEMLWEQGVGQFELWTKRRAPYSVMKQAVLKNCLPNTNNNDENDNDDDDVVVVDAVIEGNEKDDKAEK